LRGSEREDHRQAIARNHAWVAKRARARAGRPPMRLKCSTPPGLRLF
jgi:hypothetical protein